MKIMTSAFSRTVVNLRVSRPFRKPYVAIGQWIEAHPFETVGVFVAVLIIGLTLIGLGGPDLGWTE